MQPGSVDTLQVLHRADLRIGTMDLPGRYIHLGERGFIRVDARRLDRDGMQGGFCSKYRDICKKTNAADRPIQVIARHAE